MSFENIREKYPVPRKENISGPPFAAFPLSGIFTPGTFLPVLVIKLCQNIFIAIFIPGLCRGSVAGKAAVAKYKGCHSRHLPAKLVMA